MLPLIGYFRLLSLLPYVSLAIEITPYYSAVTYDVTRLAATLLLLVDYVYMLRQYQFISYYADIAATPFMPLDECYWPLREGYVDMLYWRWYGAYHILLVGDAARLPLPHYQAIR